MKKITLLIGLLLGINLLTFAQRKDDPATLFELSEQKLRQQQGNVPKKTLSFSLGFAMPEGTFGSIFEAEQGGFARTGLLLSVDGSYLLKKNYGIGATLAFYNNGVQKDGYRRSLMRHLPSNINGNISTSPWTVALAAAGPYLTFAESGLIVDLRFLLGLGIAKAPAFSFDGTYNQSIDITDTRGKTTSLRPAMAFGASISYPLPIWYEWSGFLKFEYTGMSAKIKTQQITQSSDYTIQSNINSSQSASIFGISIGIRKEFWF